MSTTEPMGTLEPTRECPYLAGVMDCLYDLQEEGGGWGFAFVDAAADQRVHQALVSSGLRSVCMFKGHALPDVVERAAPRLVDLEWGLNDFTEWMLSEGWGRGWSVIGTTRAPMHELWKHFRKQTHVKDPQHRKLYFRFHDPRVLRVFLPTCSKERLADFFGPVRYFLVEGPDPSEAWRFQLSESGELERSRHLLI